MMRRIHVLGLLLCLGLCVGGGVMAEADDTATDGNTEAPRVVAYYAGWNVYERAYFVRDVPAAQLTHLIYAFANISDDGECLLGDPWAEIERPVTNMMVDYQGSFREMAFLKKDHPHLKTLLAIGGWTWSGKFSDVALTTESREKFAASCVAMMKQYGFDGLDIDWEFPGGGGLAGNISRPQDPQNFTLLLAALRQQLDAQAAIDQTTYLLTIAAPATENQYRQLELEQIAPLVDWINLMLYDFAGGWSSKTAFHANLYATQPETTTLNAHESIQGYLAGGVPAEKIVLGVPFYGRGWTGVPPTNDGFNQSYTGLAGDESYVHYRQLAAYLENATVYWDADALATWLYDADAGVMISYDDPQTLAIKAAYILEHGLGGAMIWEIGLDDDAHTLLHALVAGLNPTDE